MGFEGMRPGPVTVINLKSPSLIGITIGVVVAVCVGCGFVGMAVLLIVGNDRVMTTNPNVVPIGQMVVLSVGLLVGAGTYAWQRSKNESSRLGAITLQLNPQGVVMMRRAKNVIAQAPWSAITAADYRWIHRDTDNHIELDLAAVVVQLPCHQPLIVSCWGTNVPTTRQFNLPYLNQRPKYFLTGRDWFELTEALRTPVWRSR